MSIRFDLIAEPWIPVVNGDETISYVGIWDALQTAAESKGISDASPLVEFGLYGCSASFSWTRCGRRISLHWKTWKKPAGLIWRKSRTT